MSLSSPLKPFIRKPLDHSAHFAAQFGAIYFVTICCRKRDRNQLCHRPVAEKIFKTAAIYDERQQWYLVLLLLMPDHLHTLVSIGGETSLSKLIGHFKRATTKFAGVHWQRNFFDHRLRGDEGPVAKAAYIRQNPVRAGFVVKEEEWPYVLDRTTLEKMAVR
jgi:putative transposase